MTGLFLGIDLGTSAVKAVAVDERGRQIAGGGAECPVHQPGPDRQEQDLDEVWAAMAAALRQALAGIAPGQLSAVSFSSAMHGMMAVEESGRPLTRMFTWADARAADEAERLARRDPAVFQRTGCPATALYYPAKISWLRDNAPDVFQRAAKFVSIKDAVIRRLTGQWITDRSHASSNGLLDVRRLEWDAPILDAIGITPERLPGLCDPDRAAGELLPGPAAELGLPAAIPVVPGAGDGGLANLGCGAVMPGAAAATIGTSGAMRKVLAEPWLDPDARLWLYYLADHRWYAGGAINSGGIILRWLRDHILPEVRDRALANGEEPYEHIIALAESAGPGAAGLIFLPYLFGERTPYWNPRARGVFFGLAPHHGQAHLARAVLEGISMSMAHLHEFLAASPGGVTQVRATGGFARSAPWVQLLADVLGTAVGLPRARENSAIGAAILGMKAMGAIRDLGQAADMIELERTFEPDLKKTAFYRERFEMFKELYEHLKADFEQWDELRRKEPQMNAD